jgi:GYF domain 2
MPSDWYYATGSSQTGPISTEEVRERLAADDFPVDALVWRQGFQSWQRPEDIREFKRKHDPVPPPLPAMPVSENNKFAPAIEAKPAKQSALPIRKTIEIVKSNLVVRVCVFAAIAAVIAWPFLPPWLKLSVVYSIGAPVITGLGVGALVGWLWLSWRLFAITAGSVGVFAFVILAWMSGLAGCAGWTLASNVSFVSAYFVKFRGDDLLTDLHNAELRLAEGWSKESCEQFAQRRL